MTQLEGYVRKLAEQVAADSEADTTIEARAAGGAPSHPLVAIL